MNVVRALARLVAQRGRIAQLPELPGKHAFCPPTTEPPAVGVAGHPMIAAQCSPERRIGPQLAAIHARQLTLWVEPVQLSVRTR